MYIGIHFYSSHPSGNEREDARGIGENTYQKRTIVIFQGAKVTGIQGCREPGLQGHKVTRLQGCRVAGLQGYKVTRLQGYKVAGLQGYKVTRLQGC